MKHLLLPLALCLAGTTAQAQEAPAPITPELLARMCSADGAMGLSFGQTGVAGSGRLDSLMGQGVRLGSEFAPFTNAKPRSTEWTDRLAWVTYEYALPEGGEASGELMVEAIASEFEAAGWTPLNLTIENTPLYLMNFADIPAFERRVATTSGEVRLLVGVTGDLGTVTLDCGRDDLMRSNAEEALGELPPGTPRPVLPVIPMPAVRTAAQCSDPAILEQTRALLEGRGPDRFIADAMARPRHNDRLTTWMMWRLSESGKISPEDLAELSLEAIGEASPGGNPMAGLALLTGLFPALEAVGEAQASGDVQAMCRSLIPVQQQFSELDALSQAQSRATHAALEAAAARLGVSLD